MSKIVGLALSISTLGLLAFSPFLVPVQAESIYAYITASPVVVEMGQSSTLTVTGYIYGSGTYGVNVEFWDSDQFEDIASPDDRVGDCKTSVTVSEVGTFTCSLDVIPSEFMTGNMEDEADWVEFYGIITAEGIDGYNTGRVLVYCSWCNAAALGPGPQT
ncbi:MAG: hypothetical protein ACE5J2_08070 [Nitrososphaerales archaeon]